MILRLVFLLLFCNLCFAAQATFEHKYEFTLRKDERASVEITELSTSKVENFDFYWTLFDTNKIIIHSKFRKYPRQFVLSMKRNLNWATQTLIPDYTNPHIDRARLILEFSDFKDKEAKLSIYIEDKEARLMVKFLDPRKPETFTQNTENN